jgi:hypothetical protein
MPEPPAPPPDHLGTGGARLWRAITEEWIIDGAGERAVLEQACAALDRADTLAARIEAAGPLVKISTLIGGELAARGLLVRLLSRLGVLGGGEPKRERPGRPPGRTRGW